MVEVDFYQKVSRTCQSFETLKTLCDSQGGVVRSKLKTMEVADYEQTTLFCLRD